jgi:hypothetical protein
VWSKCELFVSNRCRGLGNGTAVLHARYRWRLFMASIASTKGADQRWWKRRIETASLGPKASLGAGGFPPLRSVFIECGPAVHHLWQTEKQTNRPTAGLTDKFGLSRSQSTGLPSAINYTAVQMWLCLACNTTVAKSVLLLQILVISLISLFRFLLLLPFIMGPVAQSV